MLLDHDNTWRCLHRHDYSCCRYISLPRAQGLAPNTTHLVYGITAWETMSCFCNVCLALFADNDPIIKQPTLGQRPAYAVLILS